MESPNIEYLVNEIKKEIFSNQEFTAFVFPSAYATAWLAMIPNNQEANGHSSGPMFESCLTWILNNQKEQGYWGESCDENITTIYTLPSTLACMIALKKWNMGESNIRKGLKFIHANTHALLKAHSQGFPRWFTILFPAMLQLAKAAGMEIIFLNGSKRMVEDVFMKKKFILESEKLIDEKAGHDQPLLAYLESLPHSYILNQQDELLNHLHEDGSLFRSPSATALAFMDTGNHKCLEYLMSIVQRCPNGVPSRFPVDEELIKLCMVDHIQRLGLSQHFTKEIEHILAQVYKNQRSQNEYLSELSTLPERLYKDSLAFRLLRMQGYNMNEGSICWFLHHPDIKAYIEKNRERFVAVMYNVYRATDVMFLGESEMEEARSYSRELLETSLKHDENLFVFPALRRVIEHELNVPWVARLEHLDHRMWIELNQSLPPSIGESSSYWLSFLHNDKLIQLAVENYEYRQSIYRKELEELKRWSKEKGLVDIGFGREKTMYSYFASAASSSSFLPYHSFLRLVVAKCSIIITVADDFYDMEASLGELQILTEAVQRWDGRNLDGPSKIIFDALDDLVCDIAKLYHLQHATDITPKLQLIWQETFLSWMMESRWSGSGIVPSMDQYLDVGLTSIAAHAIVLQAASLASPSLPTENLPNYENITKLLMATTRLLNDIQSYQKEREDGKMNYVLLHLNENPGTRIEDSINFVKEILGDKKKEFLENVLIDGFNDMPRSSKLLHLSCLNVFHMFFNSCNLFDTKTALLEDIMRAIYIPLDQHDKTSMPPLKTLPTKLNQTEIPLSPMCLLSLPPIHRSLSPIFLCEKEERPGQMRSQWYFGRMLSKYGMAKWVVLSSLGRIKCPKKEGGAQ
uniref:Putative geranyllinalool synthase n=1 Tax=Petunia integrifolia subsp. inflata TaxID=212142 RepID=A0A088DBZ3_PETIN|nr:putative geranyllinalool synthase [Petunia integrifolia subsp. inflata]